MQILQPTRRVGTGHPRPKLPGLYRWRFANLIVRPKRRGEGKSKHGQDISTAPLRLRPVPRGDALGTEHWCQISREPSLDPPLCFVPRNRHPGEGFRARAPDVFEAHQEHARPPRSDTPTPCVCREYVDVRPLRCRVDPCRRRGPPAARNHGHTLSWFPMIATGWLAARREEWPAWLWGSTGIFAPRGDPMTVCGWSVSPKAHRGLKIIYCCGYSPGVSGPQSPAALI